MEWGRGRSRARFSPGSAVLRLAPTGRPSPLLSSVRGSRAPGLGLPPGQADKVQGAPGCGSSGGQLAGGFELGEWQQGGSLAEPAAAGEGAPLAEGVKATGLWVDFRAFSGAGSSSSRGWSPGLRCGEGRAQAGCSGKGSRTEPRRGPGGTWSWAARGGGGGWGCWC